MYNGSVRLPFLPDGADYTSLQEEPSTPGMRAPSSLASPALMKSPLLRRVSQEYESPAGVLTLAAKAVARRAAEVATAENANFEGRPRASSSERRGLVGGGGGVVRDPEYGTGR